MEEKMYAKDQTGKSKLLIFILTALLAMFTALCAGFSGRAEFVSAEAEASSAPKYVVGNMIGGGRLGSINYGTIEIVDSIVSSPEEKVIHVSTDVTSIKIRLSVDYTYLTAMLSFRLIVVDNGETTEFTSFNNGGTNEYTLDVSSGNHTLLISLDAGGMYQGITGNITMSEQTVLLTRVTVFPEIEYEPTYTGQTIRLSSGLTALGIGSARYTVKSGSSQATNAGTYTAVLQTASELDYFSNKSHEITVTWKIKKADYDTSGITWGNSAFSYTGSVQQVTASGTIKGVKGELISISRYENGSAINAGTYTATAIFDYDRTNYNDPNVTKSWSIARVRRTIEIRDQSAVYSGSEPIVSKVAGTDYAFASGEGFLGNDNWSAISVSLQKAAGVNAGSYAIEGAYSSTNYEVTFVSGTYIIAAKDISKDTAIEDIALTYNGSAQEPVPVVRNSAGITANDYTVTYENNRNVGTATLTLTGKNNFTGTISKTFRIEPKNIGTDTEMSVSGSFTYNGSAQEPVPVVRNTASITSDDYVITYRNNTDAGTATVVITGRNNFTGTKSIDFEIAAKDISRDTTIEAITLSYNGSAQEPAPVVSNTASITANDYDVAYENNKDAGTGRIILTGKGNFTGTFTTTFVIERAAITVVWSNTNFVYDGETHLPAAEAAGLGNDGMLALLLKGGASEAGSHEATAELAENEINKNYVLTNAIINFTIGGVQIAVRPIAGISLQYGEEFDGSNSAYWEFLTEYNGVEYAQPLESDLASLGIYLVKTEGVTPGTYALQVMHAYSGAEYGIVAIAGEMQITRRSITLMVPDAQSEYGDADAEMTYYLADGFSLGYDDKLSDLHVSLTRQAGTAVGEYDIFATSRNGNYFIAFDTGIYSIVPREITIDIGDVERQYGDTITTPTQWRLAEGCTMAYGESTDVLRVALAKAEGTSGTAARDYEITGAWSNGSYNVTFNNGTYRITPKSVTVVIKDRQSVYGEEFADLTNQPASWELQYGSAMAYGEHLTALNVTLAKEEGDTVGEYTITGEWSNDNYSVTFVEGRYTITKARFNVEVNPYNGIYDGEGHTVNVVLDGLDGATVQYSADGETWQDEAIEYTGVTEREIVYVKIKRDNYFDYVSSATVEIKAKELTVEWTFEGTTSTNYTWVYDNTVKQPGARAESGIAGIELTLTVSGGQTNASDKAYVAVASLTEPNENFLLKNAEHEFYIIRARIGAEVNQPDLGAQLFTNGKLPELTLKGTFSMLGTIAWDDYVIRADEGTYYWTFTPADTRNYEIEHGSFTFNNIVEMAAERIEVDAQNAVKTYVYGEAMSREGVTVKMYYNDGSSTEVSGYVFRYENGGDFFLAGETIITVVVSTGATQEFTARIEGLTVEKKAVERPETRELTYNRESQQVQFAAGTDTTLFTVDTLGQIDAGRYTATITLKDRDNYRWTDSETASIEVEWTIRALTLSIEPEVDCDRTVYTDDEALPELKLSEENAMIGSIAWDGYIISAAKREYGWTFTPNAANANNYTVVTGSVVFMDIRVSGIVSIEVTKNPDKMEYEAFERLALDGMELTVSFESGKTVVRCDGFDVRYAIAESFRAGDESVIIVYNGGTGDFTTVLSGFTVTKIVIDAPAAEQTTFEYDNTEKSLSLAESDLYMVGGENSRKDAGRYTAILMLTDPDNYAWSGVDGADFEIEWSISPKHVRIVIDDKSSVYGEEIKELTWKLADGFALAGGDSEEDMFIMLTKALGNNVVEGGYAITGVCGNSNYDVEFESGVYTITEKTLRVIVDSTGAQYGDPEAVLSWSLQEGEELAFGENEEILGITLARDAGRDVGEYIIRLSYANRNYKIEFDPGMYSITPREITIVIYDQSSVYGAAFADLTQLTAWDLKDGFTLAYGEQKNVLAVQLTKATGRDAGVYDITGTYSNGSYSVTFEKGAYTVTPKAITVEVFGQSSVYGQPLAEMGLGGWRLADGSAMAYGEGRDALGVKLSKAEGADVGIYDIVGAWDNENYEVTFVGGEDAYEIIKADRTVEVRPYDGIYDGEAHTLIVNAGDGDTVWYSTERNGEYTTEALTYADVVDGAIVYIKITNRNYNDFYANNTVTVKPKEITLVWRGNNDSTENFVYTYDGRVTFCPTAEADSGIDGITLIVTVTGGQIDASEEAYTARATIDNGNFTIANPTQEFYINGMPLPITVAPVTDTTTALYAYGRLPELRLSDAERLLGTIAWDTYTITSDQLTYTWTFTPNSSNYAKQHGSFTFTTVNERYVTEITVDATSVEKSYTAFDTFKPDGISITLHFSDGATEAIDYNTGKFRYESGTYFLAAHTKVSFVYSAATPDGEQEFVVDITGIRVAKKAIEVPAATGALTYNKETQSPVIAESDYYTITENAAINAGTYYAVLILRDADNTMWSDDNGSSDKRVEWRIEKATPAIRPSCDTVTTIWTSGTLPELGLTTAERELGTIAWDSYKLSAETKTYGWTFTPYDSANYNAAIGAITFQDIRTDRLTGIVINAQPIDKTYTAFERLATEGLAVTAHFESGASRELSMSELTFAYDNGDNSFRVGDTKVTVRYEADGITQSAEINNITVNPIRVTAPDVEDGKSFVYTGSAINATNAAGSEYDVRGTITATNAGNYVFTISLKDKVNYSWTNGGTDDIVVNWSIAKATINTDELKLEDVTVTYDGEAHGIAVSGLPAGVTVTYEGNDRTDAGVYTVTARFGVDANYEAIADMTATLRINKAVIDMSGAKLEDVTVTYDGEAHGIAVSGLPAGVTVTYEGNDRTDAGVYTVTARFEVDANYEAIADMTATLRINKAVIDMSGVKLEDVTVTYDGQSHGIAVSGLPAGVTVTYEGNDRTDAGVYTVTARFASEDSNYELTITELTAKLTITASGQKKSNTGLIVGLAVGGAAVVGLAAAAIVVIRKRKARK